MQTTADELTGVLYRVTNLANSWNNELSAMNLSWAALVIVFVLFWIIFIASKILLLSSNAGYVQANARNITGAFICLALCIAEVYMLVRITGYVPPGNNKPAFYSAMSMARKDCVLSHKGWKDGQGYRDCDHHQGPECTIDEPCTPCVIDEQMTDDVKARVIQQSGGENGTNYYNCKICPLNDQTNKTMTACTETFKDGIGPYCYFRGYHKVLELKPCVTCCVPPKIVVPTNITNSTNLTR
jgi:hypothetical protein